MSTQNNIAALIAQQEQTLAALKAQATTDTPKPAAERPKHVVNAEAAFKVFAQADLDKMKPADQIAYLKAYTQHLQQRRNTVTLQVSEKGAVSIYGLGKFPVTLYREQMERLLSMKGEIEAFMAANSAVLKVKGK